MGAQVTIDRKHQKTNFIVSQSFHTYILARTYESFTAVKGTPDDQPLVIYSVPRSYPTFGQSVEQIVQLTGDEGRNTYNAYGVTLNKQYSN